MPGQTIVAQVRHAVGRFGPPREPPMVRAQWEVPRHLPLVRDNSGVQAGAVAAEWRRAELRP